MNIRHLEVFWAVMRTGSEHGASRLLGISQPAVSKMLRYAEDRLGMPLFKRSKGRLYPTAEAERLYPEIDSIFGRIESVQRLALDLRDSLAGRIKVAAIPTLAVALLPDSISSFTQSRPRVKIGLKILPTAQVIDRVVNKQVDIGIVYAPIDDSVVDSIALRGTEIVCVMPHGHRLASRPFVTPQDLAGERLISVNRISPWGLLIEQAFKACGVQRETVIDCNHSVIAYALVEAKAGIAIVEPVLTGGAERAQVVVRPFRPLLEIQPIVVCRRGESLSRLTLAYVEHLIATAENLPSPIPKQSEVDVAQV